VVRGDRVRRGDRGGGVAMSEIALPRATRAAIFLRLLAVQGSWNYETLLGNGIAFALEPALRRLPGGRAGDAYRAAMAREARYFNSHPYTAALAVGALARLELEGEAPERIERFRAALCGPLGSIGDQLVWAGWLPFCAMLALFAFGLGATPLATAALFLVVYNAGHIWLCAWGLDAGWSGGMRVAAALGTPALRQAPHRIGALALVLGGAAIPLAAKRLATVVFCPNVWWAVAFSLAAAVLAAALVRARGKVEGWRVALGVLALVTAVAAW
jgi:PTS system mannose-specific IID component